MGISFTIIGVLLVALSFISYLMGDDFGSINLFPTGIILFVAGRLLVRKARLY